MKVIEQSRDATNGDTPVPPVLYYVDSVSKGRSRLWLHPVKRYAAVEQSHSSCPVSAARGVVRLAITDLDCVDFG